IYQNFAVRKIDERVYQTPYIGTYAFEIQLKNKQAELEIVNADITVANQNLGLFKSVLDRLIICNIDVIEENIEAPQRFRDTNELIQKEKFELTKAENDPNYIQIQIQIEECGKQVKKLQEDYDNTNN